MKVYLAAPFFNARQCEIYDKVVKMLRKRNPTIDLFVPRDYKVPDAWSLPNWEWGAKVFHEDVQSILDCDLMIVLNYGMDSDTGTAWEAGFAYGLNASREGIDKIQIFNILCDGEYNAYSLMVTNGSYATFTLEDFLTWELDAPIANCFEVK